MQLHLEGWKKRKKTCHLHAALRDRNIIAEVTRKEVMVVINVLV